MNDFEVLKLKKETDIDKSFTCGVDYIDRNIKDSYYPYICRHEDVYFCKFNNEILGYSIISIREICPNEIDLYAEYFADSKSFGVVYLNYIAIKETKQHNGYGTRFLCYMLKKIREHSKILPIRFITLEALKDKVQWYEDKGFKKLDSCYSNGNQRMYLDIMSCEEFERINSYMKEEMGNG